jgi:FKBP-type peptidyl-prolyl cis-trans isomerase SlpA
LSEEIRLIDPGCEVTLHFSLGTTDGQEAVSTFGEEPSTVLMGAGALSDGLERALYGLKAGDKETLILPPEEAFGLRDESKIQDMPLEEFPPEMALEPGLVVGFSTPAGDEVGGIIMEIREDEVTVDFNHPLAGETVVFRVEILAVRDAPEEPRIIH